MTMRRVSTRTWRGSERRRSSHQVLYRPGKVRRASKADASRRRRDDDAVADDDDDDDDDGSAPRAARMSR